MFLRLSVLGLVAVLLSSCLSDEVGDTSPGKKDAELAVLMRQMFDESMTIKQRVRSGEKLIELDRFEEIHQATPTDPSVKGPIFDGFAQAYIESVSRLAEADTAQFTYFNAMVDACMACHTQFCPGPRMKIKKLYLN